MNIKNRRYGDATERKGKPMIIRIIILAASLIFGSVAHAEETPWTNWGSAPYASSQEEAFRLLPTALVALGIPNELHEEFIDMVSENPDGEEIFLDPDDHLVAMMSGGANPHAMFDVPVAAVPVNQSGTIVQSARARKWEIEYEGVMYTLILPEICFNWSYAVREIEVRTEIRVVETPPEDCVAVSFETEPGDQVRVAFHTTEGRLPRSPCWGLVDNGYISDVPAPCDFCDWDRVDRLYRGDILRRSVYTTEQGGHQVLLMPVQMSTEGHFISVCITRNGRQSCSVTVNPVGRQTRGRERVRESEDDWYEPAEEAIIGGNPIVLFAPIPNEYWIWGRRCPNG